MLSEWPMYQVGTSLVTSLEKIIPGISRNSNGCAVIDSCPTDESVDSALFWSIEPDSQGPEAVTALYWFWYGFNQWRRERNAKLQIDNSEISLNQTKLNIEAQINTLFVNYISGIDLTKLTRENVAIAKRNLDISLEKYKLGNITPLEIREAERNYLAAQSTFFEAEYQSKIAEVTLNHLTNSINIQ